MSFATALADLSWLEAEPRLAADPLLLWPLGAALKEHGPHLPLNNDLRLAEALADRLCADPRAEPLRLLRMPALGWSAFPAFADYPGSTSLRRETSAALISETLASLARHGARRAYILNTGISTLPALRDAAADLAPSLTLRFTDTHAILGELRAELLQQRWGTHADEAETSMMLELCPEIVRMELAQRDDSPDAPGPLRRDPALPGVYSPTGAWGDPTLARRETGAQLVSALIRGILSELEGFSTA